MIPSVLWLYRIGIFGTLSLLTTTATTSAATVHVCNRGFCYNKVEEWAPHSPSLSARQKKFHPHPHHHQHPHHSRGTVLDSCTGDSKSWELYYAILGTELMEEEEAVECIDCPPPKIPMNDTKKERLNIDWDVLEDEDLDLRRSWKDEPKRGNCYDDELGYLYDCNLVEILE